ncbi:MAG: bifunctional nuclease family protein [Planctomycetes bacterium]|nr:bifunctional nuclease family protein [Planctomycetota bacterium]
MKECELSRIVLRDTAEEQYIFLREKDGGGRVFPILIGRFEARAIDRTVRRQAFPRPMTHDLLAAIVEATGTHLERVEITDLREGTYFATLHLRRDTETVKVDARPSDAVALAVRMGSPIFVAEAVLEEAAEK